MNSFYNVKVDREVRYGSIQIFLLEVEGSVQMEEQITMQEVLEVE